MTTQEVLGYVMEKLDPDGDMALLPNGFTQEVVFIFPQGKAPEWVASSIAAPEDGVKIIRGLRGDNNFGGAGVARMVPYTEEEEAKDADGAGWQSVLVYGDDGKALFTFPMYTRDGKLTRGPLRYRSLTEKDYTEFYASWLDEAFQPKAQE